MLNANVHFTCSSCREEVQVTLESVKVIEHDGSVCPCEYCGYDPYTEYKVNCPKCGKELTSL